MNAITIRVIQPLDLPVVAALLGELGYPASVDELPSRLERLQQDGRSAVYVAARGPEVVGLATVHCFAAIHASTPVALLTSLVVAESVRGQGVGRRLVDAAENWARESGCGRIIVTTAEHRSSAHAFYESLGWEYTGRRYARILPDP
jgi:GNAT superfamily N-acetyltransferase